MKTTSITKTVLKEIIKAEHRIRPFIRETFLEYSPFFSELSDVNVYFKLENLQNTGSFKTRGAMNKILSLEQSELDKGVLAASTGNHGMAVAYSLSRLNARGVIYVPGTASKDKIEAIKRYGTDIKLYGDDCVIAEAMARQTGMDKNKVYISGYNDLQVIGGQGTIGIELEKQLDNIDSVFVSLGGGGLISGISAYLKSVSAKTNIIGCSPQNSQVMIQSVKAGKILDLLSLPTLSDGTAGGVEPGSLTFDLCQNLVDDYITVTEEEIAEYLLLFIKMHNMLIEGSAAVALASFMKQKNKYKGKNVVIILCGANIGFDTLKNLMSLEQ